eukprot:s43_g50.t1
MARGSHGNSAARARQLAAQAAMCEELDLRRWCTSEGDWRATLIHREGNFEMLGSVEDALNVSALRQHSVDAVLNAAYSGCMYSLLCHGRPWHGDVALPFTAAWYRDKLCLDAVEVLALDAEDSPQYPISGHFAESNEFLFHCRREGRKVLVHCVAGQNRSATLCCAFLMHRDVLDLSLDQAFALLATRRPGVLQNRGFLKQLMALEPRCQVQPEPLPPTPAVDVAQPKLLLGDVQERDSIETVEPPAPVARKVSRAGYDSALAEFEAALCFMTEETSGFKEDPVLQLRVGSILHLKSEEQNFSDRVLAERAVKHYKKSAMAAPTAETWKNIGLCRYRRVKYETSTARKEKKLQEAMKYFYEANVLDRERPDTLAWLTICAVELGQVQVAKQGFRQLMQFEERLASPLALELAEVLLRFSNEQRATEWGGERGRLVQDGRYAKEAAMLSKVLLGRSESGPARCILAWSKFLQGEHGAAAGEFCASLTSLVTEKPQMLEEAAYMARHCAALIPGEPHLSALVEEVGERVALQGLNTQRLNGQFGIVISNLSTSSGRYGLELEDGKQIAVRPCNMRRCLATRTSSRSVDGEDESATFTGQCHHRATFCIGDVVQVFGLEQTVLNGQTGCVISDLMAPTRYGVRLRNGRSVAVRFQNLKFLSVSNAQPDMEAHFSECQVQPFRFPPGSARPEESELGPLRLPVSRSPKTICPAASVLTMRRPSPMPRTLRRRGRRTFRALNGGSEEPRMCHRTQPMQKRSAKSSLQ